MNLELAEQIVGLMAEYPLSEISVASDGRRVCARKTVFAPVAGASAPITQGAAGADLTPVILTEETEANIADTQAGISLEAVPEEARTLTATMVGIFHHAEPPIPYAAVITAGQVIGSIESMKLMNEVVAESDGRVSEVLIEDGAPVEYGQSLFRLLPA